MHATAGSSAAAAAIAAQIQAIKACGSLIRVAPQDFALILTLQESPFVVHAIGGFFSTQHRYLTSYRGLTFHCKSPEELALPSDTVVIKAERMTMPEV